MILKYVGRWEIGNYLCVVIGFLILEFMCLIVIIDREIVCFDGIVMLLVVCKVVLELCFVEGKILYFVLIFFLIV